MKKCLSFICAMLLYTVFALGLTGCGNNDTPAGSKISAREVYALSAVSGVSYLRAGESSVMNSGVLLASVPAYTASAPADTRPSAVSDEDVAGIKDCLTMFEGILTDGVKQTVSQNNETGEFSDYAFVMVISVPNPSGYEEFKMYYNEVETETQTKVKDGVEESEVSTTLTGIMTVGDEVFEVSGEREVETEGDEFEASIEFTTKSRTHSGDFVKVSQTVENDEIEFEYEIYKDGKKIRELEVEIEHDEDGKTELEFSLKDKTQSTLNKTKYSVEKEKNSNIFEIKFTTETSTDSLTAEKTDNGYTLTYSNGFTETV